MTSFTLFIDNFHFIRPLWLIGLFALFPLLWLLKKHRFYQSPWQQFLPAHLSQVLVEGASNTSTNNNKSALAGKAFLIKPFLIGLLSILALAGPAWQKLPQPVYQTERGSVLIMDMSYSMYATDIKPNRLTRARFKAIDLLKKINEGDTGLIAYAGDAFVISPLTQDIKNIELLLPSLTPEIMPKPGANPLAALTLAHEMLLNAGHLTGDIYWFTDDVDNEELTDIYDWSNKFGHQLNILGVGSEAGAPITLPNGELLKDDSGAIVIPRLPSQKLKSLALRGHGNYQTIRNDDRDINNLIIEDTLLDQNGERNKKKQQESQQTGDQWQEQGAWLLLLVLPLMLGYFRRGSAILMLPFTCLPLLFLLSFSVISPASYAADNTEKPVTQAMNQESEAKSEPQPSALARTWNNLWQTKDQQAQQHYNQDNFQAAAQQFENSQWQGSAHYKAGNYQAALEAFKKGEQANSADSLYNQGNAQAQLQQYEQAIESYERALKQNPSLQDAKDNIEKIKQLQKEQEQQQQQQQSDQSEDQQSQDQKEQQKDQQSQDQQSQDQESQQNQQQSDDAQQQQKDQDGESNNNEQQNDPQNQPEESSKEQEGKEAEQKQQEQQSAAEAEQADKDQQQGEEKTAAQIAEEQQAKETEQKHIQLLNKVTDDPYLLLRNKMQLEYQKRKQDGASQGVKKKW